MFKQVVDPGNNVGLLQPYLQHTKTLEILLHLQHFIFALAYQLSTKLISALCWYRLFDMINIGVDNIIITSVDKHPCVTISGW